MRIFTPAVLFFVLSFGCLGMSAGETQPYEVNAVTNPVYGINDSARFSGSAPSLGGIQAYFGSTTSLPSNLGKFGGTNATGVAISADDAGDAVVAVSIDGTKGATYRKVNRVYTTTSLPGSVPTGINKDGWACGWKSVSGNLHAFASNPSGTIKDLTPNATYGYAYAMNNSGWIVGEIDGAAFRWDPSTFNNNPASGVSLIQHNDFGPADQSYAASINNNGQILVVVKHDNVNRTFIWDAGTVTECLAPEGMSATGAFINNSGDVIGYADTTPVYWWHDGYDMQEFSTLTQTPLTVTHFYGFNNSGDIVASGSDGNGNTWFYLERVPDGSDTIPPLVTNLAVAPVQNGYVTSTTPNVTATVTDGGFGVNWTCLYFMIDDVDIDWDRDGSDITGIPFEAISEGPHTATINVRDHVGNITVTDCIFTVDTIAPEIASNGPIGWVTATTQPQIAMVITDDGSGVDWDSLHLFVDTADVAFDRHNDEVSFIAETDMSDGSHIISVLVSDYFGRVATLEWEFFIDVDPTEFEDFAPPFTNVSYPLMSVKWTDFPGSSGVDLDSLAIWLDNDLIVEGGVSLSEHLWMEYEGEQLQIQFQTNELSAGRLEEGAHSIEYFGADMAGNLTTRQFAIVVDTLPPTVVYHFPPSSSVIIDFR